jgi:hypothetical protein
MLARHDGTPLGSGPQPARVDTDPTEPATDVQVYAVGAEEE